MNIAKLKSELIRDEGLRLKPYKDTVGKLTIGVGRNIDDMGITHDEAMFLLGNDISFVEADLDAKLPWWRNLDEVRQRVLANMVFNLGITRFLRFKNTIALIEVKRYKAASEEMLKSVWAEQVGIRAKRLAQMMCDGKEPV